VTRIFVTRMISIAHLLSCFLIVSAARAHDTWVQTNTNAVRVGETVHIDLMLGNHGNQHRDFKLMGKLNLKYATLQVLRPDGRRFDLKSRLRDMGCTEEEGFWTTKVSTPKSGLYTVAHTADQVMTYGPVRSLKSAKAFFAAHNVARSRVSGFNKRLNHPLELVPETSPLLQRAKPFAVRLWFKGKPLANTRVAFIPRGVQLQGNFDRRYERTTNANGRVSFTPQDSNYYLVVAHHETPEKGNGYESTKYAATLTLYVP
jgi:uncharacterized GH25 family protein